MASGRRFLYQQIAPRHLYWPLVITAFYTGLLDAVSFAQSGTFASNQTGNVVILGLGIAELNVTHLRDSGTSLAAYLTAGFLGGQLGHFFGHRTRWWLGVSNLIQNLIFMLALIFWYGGVVDYSVPGNQWVYILIMAAAAGGQVAIARNVSVPEVPTAMLSSPLIDFVTDPNLLRPSLHDPRVITRNRRFGYILSITSGAFVGAVVHRFALSGPVFIFSFVLKVVVMVWMFFLPGEETQKRLDECEKPSLSTLEKCARDRGRSTSSVDTAVHNSKAVDEGEPAKQLHKS